MLDELGIQSLHQVVLTQHQDYQKLLRVRVHEQQMLNLLLVLIEEVELHCFQNQAR
jgi:hypothetical protein